MKKILLTNIRLLSGSLTLLALVFLAACNNDDADDPIVFDAPTLAVVVDNNQPFQGDVITFNITASADAGLSSVTLNGEVIKEYSDEATTDEFTHEVTIAEDAAVGPVAFDFVVTDAQVEAESDDFSVSVTIQNADLRGAPFVLTDFQSGVPNASVEAVTFDSGPNSWEAAYSIDPQAEDPMNPANIVLQANRLGATEWYFQGGGAVFIQTASFLNEEDIQAIIDGERVLQMNMMFEETERLVTVHNNPDDPANNSLEADLSYKFDALNADNYEDRAKYNSWNFEEQDSVPGISVRIEVGNQAAWDWNNGDPLGKKFYLAGSITTANEWQTVTFSPMYNDGTEEEPLLKPRTLNDENATYIDDTAIGNDQVNYMGISLNNRTTSYPNPDGYFEMPGNGNGWTRDRVANIQDNHNRYYMDNIRIIDADAYDQNPNN